MAVAHWIHKHNKDGTHKSEAVSSYYVRVFVCVCVFYSIPFPLQQLPTGITMTVTVEISPEWEETLISDISPIDQIYKGQICGKNT